MKKMLWMTLVFTVLSLGLTGCEPGYNDRNAEKSGNRSGATMTDTDLENSIKAKLDSDQQLKSAGLSVSADVDKNEVTLSGTVDSQALRMKAVEMAKSAHAGLVVIDKIDVKPREVSRSEYTEEQARGEREKAKSYGERVGDSLDDAWIHAKIVTKLIGDPDTPQRKINVDVVNNVVTLRGTVDTPNQKAEAEQIAKDTEGVKRVNNQLKVGGAKSMGR